MTRDEYIKAVKAKLEEISPFDEPITEDGKQGFIAADGDPDYQEVKPIVSYIESELDNSARYCLESLPITLLAEDVDNDKMCMHVDENGVGHIKDIYDYLRILRVSCKPLERDITAMISSASPLYLLQQNEHTRGGLSKPVACFTPERAEIEVFSFPKGSHRCCHKDAKVYYIDCRVKAENVHSHIEPFIILACAIRVLRIIGDDNAVTRLTNEFQEEVASIQA